MVREGGREGGKLLSKLVVETLLAKGVTSLKKLLRTSCKHSLSALLIFHIFKLRYNLHIVKFTSVMYNFTSFENPIQLYNHYHNQDAEHFHKLP